MGDQAEIWRSVKDRNKRLRAQHGQPCPKCVELLPKACPTILLPKQTCKIHGYVRPKTNDQGVRMTQDEFRAALRTADLSWDNCYVRLNHDRTAIDRIRLRGVRAHIEWRPRLSVWDVVLSDGKVFGRFAYPLLVAREVDLSRAVEFAKTVTYQTPELNLKSERAKAEAASAIGNARRTSKELS